MKMKYILFLTTTLYIVSQIAFAQKRNERDSGNTITFKIKNAGIEVIGSIDVDAIQIVFDENDLERSTVIASANPKTINTGIRIRDQHLHRSDYFDVEHYPAIKLISKKFSRSGKKFEGHFDLTIKNKTSEVVIPFIRKRKNGIDSFEGSFEIDRIDFQLGDASAILDERVQIFFQITP